MIQLYFGGERLPFGLPPTQASLNAYLAMLDGTGLPWSVAVLGGDLVGSGLAEHALERGGHLRVGFGGLRRQAKTSACSQNRAARQRLTIQPGSSAGARITGFVH
jgi:hypothetical protein